MYFKRKYLNRVLLTFLVLGCFACSEENIELTNSAIELRFSKSNDWEKVSNGANIVNVSVEVIKTNGKLRLKSDLIDQRSVYLSDGTRSKLITLRKGNLKDKPLFSTGYLLYPDNCFYYSRYIEDDDGAIIVLNACGFADCVGFEPVCAGDRESWV